MEKKFTWRLDVHPFLRKWFIGYDQRSAKHLQFSRLVVAMSNLQYSRTQNLNVLIYGGFLKWGVPNSGWFIGETPIFWMIWGYLHWWKPPHINCKVVCQHPQSPATSIHKANSIQVFPLQELQKFPSQVSYRVLNLRSSATHGASLVRLRRRDLLGALSSCRAAARASSDGLELEWL